MSQLPHAAQPIGRPVVYSFGTRSRCPNRNCRSLETRADTTRGAVQYRKCLKCGQRYTVRGSPM